MAAADIGDRGTAGEILKDKPESLGVFILLKRMMPLRQIEATAMMVGMNHYSKGYVRALLTATPEAPLVPDKQAKVVRGVSGEQGALVERETAQLDRQIKVAERSYGTDHLRLVLARGCVRKLIAKERVLRYLGQYQPEVLAAFQKIAEMGSAAGGPAGASWRLAGRDCDMNGRRCRHADQISLGLTACPNSVPAARSTVLPLRFQATAVTVPEAPMVPKNTMAVLATEKPTCTASPGTAPGTAMLVWCAAPAPRRDGS